MPREKGGIKMRNETEYASIDYGMGITNINPKTGIRYGIINQNEIGQHWFDDSEANYKYECSNCGSDIEEELLSDECPHCGKEFDHDEWDMFEPVSFSYDSEGYKMEQLGDDTDIFVFESKYYTYAQFCSPCAPGAGHLMNPLKDKIEANKTYCLGHEWFEGKAPYKVYSVETGRRIFPEK